MLRPTLLKICASIALMLAAAGVAFALARVPGGFALALVASDLGEPTGFAFTPDGRMLVATKAGALYVYRPGPGMEPAARVATALDLRAATHVVGGQVRPLICSNALERGLQSVAVDPDFAANGHIYLFYTFNRFGECNRALSNELGTPQDVPMNRLVRLTMAGDRAPLASELVLIDNMPSVGGGHNGGDVQFGPDGYLYVSVGDGYCDPSAPPDRYPQCQVNNGASRDPHILLGKILRITRDGGIPPDNPFRDPSPTARRCNQTGRTAEGQHCQETYAWGLRNPFRFAFDRDSATPRLFINDVGGNVWEEINEGVAGADYGWNRCEGRSRPNSFSIPCDNPPPGTAWPLFTYDHDTTSVDGNACTGITGAAFVPRGIWPAPYDGAYLFADYACGTIFRLAPDSGGYRMVPFAEQFAIDSVVHMAFGPAGGAQALYLTTRNQGGQIYRISYTGAANRAPAAAIAATPSFGKAPLSVRFSAAGSADPDGDALSYRWEFGDGTPAVTSAGPEVSHTYTAPGVYSAAVRAVDGDGATSAAARLRIDVGNTPPEVAIVALPPPFRVGELITLEARASDAEDGALAGAALSWRVIVHHNDHTHPYVDETPGASISFRAPAPEDLDGAPRGYLEALLTAVDSAGRASTLSVRLEPARASVALGAEPAGVELLVNGEVIATPASLTSWVGHGLELGAPPTARGPRGEALAFAGWSDGSAQRVRSLATPAGGLSLTARYGPAAEQRLYLPALRR